jgi:cysteine sulfinate desulfinase/cysteine desulfurase-like protein
MSLLEVEAITMRFGGLVAVKGFNLTLNQGEIVALIGPNGAGKTTVFIVRHISNILSVSFKGVRGEVLLHGLEEYNIYVSTGSACSSKKATHKNYVLPAIGLEQCFIEGTIRFSFSYLNTIEEVDTTIEVLKKVLAFLRRVKK